MSIPNSPPIRRGFCLWLQSGGKTVASVTTDRVTLHTSGNESGQADAVTATAERVRDLLLQGDSDTWDAEWDDFLSMVRLLRTGTIDIDRFGPDDLPALLRLHAVVCFAQHYAGVDETDVPYCEPAYYQLARKGEKPWPRRYDGPGQAGHSAGFMTGPVDMVAKNGAGKVLFRVTV